MPLPQSAEEQNCSIFLLWIKSLGPSTDGVLLLVVCLNKMQNITSVHISCVLESTGFAIIQPPVILFYRHCISYRQLHLYDSIPLLEAWTTTIHVTEGTFAK